MIRDLGLVPPGSTIYLPFHTFDSNDPSASVTLTGLAVTDVEVYKDGSMTQRASDAGYTLLDTDGIDLDGITGIHGLSISLADNTTAGFWAAGSQYWVVISSVTVDAATINFILGTFCIGYPGAVLNTTIATLSTQTSFTLTNGPAEDDALNGCVVCIHDVASAVQLGFAVVQDYTGSTKTVTLTAGVTFTAAATDNISVFPPANAQWGGTVAYTATRGLAGTALPAAAADGAGGLPISDAGGLDLDARIGTDIPAILVDTGTTLQGELDGIQADTEDIQARLPAALVSGRIDASVGAMAANVMTAAAAAADLTTELQSGLATAASLATTDGKVDSILADTNELQTDWANGGRLDLLVDGILEDTGTTLQGEMDGIQADTEDIQSRIPAALTAGGNIKADAVAISGDATAADRLEALMDGTIVAQVNDVGATTTSFIADGFTEATNDHFNGRLITFISGALSGQQTAITDYVGATQTFTVTDLTEAPADDVFFVIH